MNNELISLKSNLQQFIPRIAACYSNTEVMSSGLLGSQNYEEILIGINNLNEKLSNSFQKKEDHELQALLNEMPSHQYNNTGTTLQTSP